MFTNFDVKDILFGQFCSDNDDSSHVNYNILDCKFISFRSKLSKDFLSTSLILTNGKEIVPILTSHDKNNQTSNRHFHNTQNGMVFCLWWNLSYRHNYFNSCKNFPLFIMVTPGTVR